MSELQNNFSEDGNERAQSKKAVDSAAEKVTPIHPDWNSEAELYVGPLELEIARLRQEMNEIPAEQPSKKEGYAKEMSPFIESRKARCIEDPSYTYTNLMAFSGKYEWYTEEFFYTNFKDHPSAIKIYRERYKKLDRYSLFSAHTIAQLAANSQAGFSLVNSMLDEWIIYILEQPEEFIKGYALGVRNHVTYMRNDRPGQATRRQLTHIIEYLKNEGVKITWTFWNALAQGDPEFAVEEIATFASHFHSIDVNAFRERLLIDHIEKHRGTVEGRIFPVVYQEMLKRKTLSEDFVTKVHPSFVGKELFNLYKNGIVSARFLQFWTEYFNTVVEYSPGSYALYAQEWSMIDCWHDELILEDLQNIKNPMMPDDTYLRRMKWTILESIQREIMTDEVLEKIYDRFPPIRHLEVHGPHVWEKASRKIRELRRKKNEENERKRKEKEQRKKDDEEKA